MLEGDGMVRLLIVILQMKLNFIQSWPEDLAKENYQLKSQLLQAKQQLSDLESRLTEAITCIAPNKPFRLTACEVLQQLVQLTKHQHSQLKSALNCGEVLRGELQQLQRQQITHARIISQRDIEIAAQKQYAQQQSRRQTQRQQQLQKEMEMLQQYNEKLVNELQKLKIDKISKNISKQQLAEDERPLQLVKNQLVRAVIQRQQIQNKLQQKARQVVRSEKDKQAMEQYYDQKWNSQYKKVKIKLEQNYNLKIAQLEQQSQLRLLSIQNQLRQMQQEKTYYLERNEQLEYRYSIDQKQKQSLSSKINLIEVKIEDFRIRSVENSLMFREEIRTIRVVHSEQRLSLIMCINELQDKIEAQKQDLRQCKNEHRVTIIQLQKFHKQQLSKQSGIFEAQKKQLINEHTSQMEQLKSDIYKQLDNAQIIKNQIERQYQSLIQRMQTEHQKAILIKQQDYNSNNQRWIHKHSELQNLLSINRRRFDEQLQRKSNQIQKRIQKEYNLLKEVQCLKEQIVFIQGQKRQLQTNLSEKIHIITQKQAIVASLGRDLTHALQQIKLLTNNRKNWKNQLLEVGMQFTQAFDQLKKKHEKQANFYKNRISQLQQMRSKTFINQRQVQKKNNFKHEYQTYKPEIHIREAENLILHKVKDYYETKLREEGDIPKTNFKNSHAILARKLKKSRAYVNEVSSHCVLEPQEVTIAKTRYSNSAQKHYNMSLSRGKFKESDERYKERTERLRVQTMSSFK